MLLDRPLLRGLFSVTFGYKELENIYVEYKLKLVKLDTVFLTFESIK